VLSGMDLRVRMGMFEEESSPVERAASDSSVSQNSAEHLPLSASLDSFSQAVKWAVRAIEPSDLL